MKDRFVDHYRICEQLGAGGMGVVYRAEDPRLGRSVAIKFFSGETTPGISVTRFIHEARTASSLSHPHICPVYDIGEFEGRPYIVMEFLEGRTLKEKLLAGTMDADRILVFALQIAEALEAAHAKGIIHRDIKPANIFVTESGVKLLDFGIAHRDDVDDRTAASTRLTSTGATVGTISYMSPEQALGKTIDHRTDFFSLGVVLYEMAVGLHPFEDRTAAATIDAILHQDPRELGLAHSAIPLGLRAVIRKLVQKSPENRYASAAELISDLRRLRTGSRLSWTVWVRPYRWRIAALLLLAILVGLVWSQGWIYGWLRADDQSALAPTPPPAGRPIVAITRLTAVGEDPDTEQIALGLAYTVATSLASVPAVTVISPGATLSHKTGERDAGVIARELGAEYVVSGAVQKSDPNIQIHLNLLRGNSVIWGGGTQGDREDLFSLQKDLVTQLIGALNLVLSDDLRVRLMRPPTENKQAYADYTQGRAFLERPDMSENLERAMRLFDAALEKDPNFSLAHAGLGEAYWAMYKRTKDSAWTDKARQAIETALRLDPDQAMVRCSLAIIYTGTGQYEKALEELRLAEQLQPNSDEVHRLRGDVFAAQGQTDEAIEAYQQAIDLRPNFWGNQRALGLVYFSKGLYQKAAECFERITELQPDLSWGFHYLGVTHHAAGNLDLAKENYQKALALGPSAGTYANLGTINYRQGDYAAAAKHYEQSLALTPASEANLRNLGDTYQKLGNSSKAEAAYIEALELVRDQLRVNPRDAQLLGMAGLLEAKLGRHQEAIRHADQALAAAPDDSLVRYRRAVVHALAGEKGAAVKLLESALQGGYSGSEASMDDDLSGLRERTDFQALLKRYQ